jgi:hypothetical protein
LSKGNFKINKNSENEAAQEQEKIKNLRIK